MTQQVFADFLGINAATLSNILNERNKPTLNIVEALKKKFPDISLEWLMYGSGPMFISPDRGAETVAPQGQTPLSSDPVPAQQQMWGQEPMLDFGSPVTPSSPVAHPAAVAQQHFNGVRNTRQDLGREEVKIIDKRPRHVTEIRVYYDDQTWESFVPAKK